ncbi:hypothetical protein D9M69_584870 [compost metagenome]
MLVRIVDLLRALGAPAQVGGHHVHAAGDQFGDAGLHGDELELQGHAQAVGHGLAHIDLVADDAAGLRILEAERLGGAHGAADELAARLDVGQRVGLGGGRQRSGQADGGDEGSDRCLHAISLEM